MSKQQTAVEWLYERLERMIPRTALYNSDKQSYFEQAKAMERQQIVDAVNVHYDKNKIDDIVFLASFNNVSTAEQYYTETFGNESPQS